MARPGNTLKWADTLAADPTSGQNNRVQYPAAYEDDGWDYQEKPPRNYDNWFKWLAGEWVQYLDQVCSRPATYVVAASDASAESKAHADAVCDGTDDHTEINAAITAVAATGGLVLLTEGTFTIDATIALASGVHIMGRGINATTIEVYTSSGTPFVMMTGSNDTHLSISNLTLDGNAASVTGTYGAIILTTGSHIRLLNLEIKEISGLTSNAVDIDGSSQVFISHCEIDNNEGIGMLIDNSAHSVHVDHCYFSTNNLELKIDANDNIVTGCMFRAGTGGGIDIVGSYNLIQGCNVRDCGASFGIRFTTGGYNQLSNCAITGNTGDGIQLSSSDGNLISNCLIATNTQHGIQFTTSDDNIIRGCYIHSNSQETDDTYSGVDLDTSATNVITDNVIRRGSGTKQHYAGIDLNGNATSNRIYGNDLYTAGKTASIYTTGGGSGKTIPAWTAAGADSSATNNLQDNVVNANRTVI